MIAVLVLIMGVIFLEMMQFRLYLYELRVVESATPNIVAASAWSPKYSRRWMGCRGDQLCLVALV